VYKNSQKLANFSSIKVSGTGKVNMKLFGNIFTKKHVKTRKNVKCIKK